MQRTRCLGKRTRNTWKFPQGGIKYGESPEQAMYRELKRKRDCGPSTCRFWAAPRDWLHHHVPNHWIKREWRGTYKGQKQIWYLLRLVGATTTSALRASEHPEFDAWRWHDYWVPLESVIEFKRDVYKQKHFTSCGVIWTTGGAQGRVCAALLFQRRW